jgi:hypothetical protein
MRGLIRVLSKGVVALSFIAACGGDSTSPGGTLGSVVYAGTFASATESGTISFSVGASGSTSATGKMVQLNGATTALSGSASSAGSVSLNGGEFSFKGTIASGTLTGTFTSSKSSGSVTADTQGTGADTTRSFCGTYVTDADYGWLNFVAPPTGAVTGFAVAGIGGLAAGGTSATITGTLSGSTLTATSNAGTPIAGVVSTDGTTVTGTYRPAGSATGSFSAGTAWCGTSTGTTSLTSAGGFWASALGLPTTLNVVLTQNGSVVGGTGAIHVSNVVGYSGDRITVLGGSFTSQSLTFTAQVGANPVGDGTFFHGTLTFTGTVSNGTSATGTLVYTPPKTATQLFAQQTVTGFTISR